jgi:hypothetical protein
MPRRPVFFVFFGGELPPPYSGTFSRSASLDPFSVSLLDVRPVPTTVSSSQFPLSGLTVTSSTLQDVATHCVSAGRSSI